LPKIVRGSAANVACFIVYPPVLDSLRCAATAAHRAEHTKKPGATRRALHVIISGAAAASFKSRERDVRETQSSESMRRWRVDGNGLTLMAVHAHPDDEVFGTGGVLARAAAEGMRTVLVTATRGDVGEIHDPDLDPEEARERLATIREGELRRACAILGIDELHILGYRDSGMVGTPDNADPRNFHNADPDEVAGRIVELMRRERPDVVVTYDARGGYGHPDHIAAHQATVAAFDRAGDPARYPEQGLEPWQPRKLYYAAFPRSGLLRMRDEMRAHGIALPFPGSDDEEFDPSSFTVPDDEITARVDVAPYVERKRAALLAHRTQIGAEHFTQLLSEDLARAMLGTESFTRARALVPAPLHEDDLFAGLS